MSITHAKVSTIAATGDPDRIQGPDWNDDHVVTLGDAADFVPDSIDANAGTTGKLTDAGHSHPDPLLTQRIVQRWYGPTGFVSFNSQNIDAPLPTLDRLYAIPFEVGDFREFDRISVVTSAAAATAQVVLGIYADGGGQPGALLLQTSAIDASPAASLVDAAFDAIYSGVVWLAAVAQTAQPDVAVLAPDPRNQSGAQRDARIGAADPISPAQFGGDGSLHFVGAYSQDSISGALPDPWGSTLNTDNAGAPYILLRAK